MSNGFVLWYEHGWSPGRVAARIASLKAAGIGLGHPDSGRITMLSDDLETAGDQIEISAEQAERALALVDTDELTIQFWFSDGYHADLVVLLRRLGETSVVSEFSLNGVSASDRQTVIDVVRHQSTSDTDAIVVDRSGECAVTDWDALVRGDPVELRFAPDVLAIDEKVAAHYPLLGIHETGRLGHLVVFDREGLLHG